MKKRLHIHSDNSTWAGCENMVGILLQHPMITSKFDISFSYRWSFNYYIGMLKWVDVEELFAEEIEKGIENATQRIFPLKFWITILYKIRRWFKPIMVFKYLCMIQEIVKLYGLFKIIKPDILHINNGGYFGATSCNSAAIAGKLAKIPIITYMINSTARYRWWEVPITWAVKKSVTKFISASKVLKNRSDFLRVEGDWGSNWAVIPNTIISREISKRDEVRSYFGINSAEIMFLCIGNWERRKGFDIAIEAFGRLQPMGHSMSLYVIGGGGDNKVKGETKVFASKKTGMTIVFDKSRIRFSDYSMINACDVLVVPSIRDEDFPNVILIAMMYGKPIIASDIGGMREMVISGLNGYLVKPNDPENLKVAMQYFIKYPDNIAAYGHGSVDCFNEKYRPDIVGAYYANLWGEND